MQVVSNLPSQTLSQGAILARDLLANSPRLNAANVVNAAKVMGCDVGGKSIGPKVEEVILGDRAPSLAVRTSD